MNYECCYQCAIPLQSAELSSGRCNSCDRQTPAFDQTVCLDRYDGALKEVLHQLKYQKRLSFAHGLSDVWNTLLASTIDDQSIDYLVPVPLSQKIAFTLKRFHDIDQQAGKNFSARQQDIHGMFYIDAKDIPLLKGKSVVVFDDVMTTGATLNEIARTLKMIGVTWVGNWVLLRTTKLMP